MKSMIVGSLLCVTAWAMQASQAQAEIIQFNGHTYELFGLGNGTTLSWTAAYIDATSRTRHGQKGYLARIETPEELTAVAGLISPLGSAWIGLTDDPTYGGSESSGQATPGVNGWVWADFNLGPKPFSQTVAASPIMQFAWSPGQPDNNGNYVRLSSGGLFFDDSNFANNYVIEYNAVPEPGTLALASLGAVALVAARLTRRNRRWLHEVS